MHAQLHGNLPNLLQPESLAVYDKPALNWRIPSPHQPHSPNTWTTISTQLQNH